MVTVVQAATQFRNQITGLVRFSYPAIGGFATESADMAALQARLYDPERLARRFDLFERLALPSLLAQTDGDFRTLFLIGRDMPTAWRDRLADLVAPLAGAKIVALDPLPHYQAIRRAYALGLPDEATHLTGFRLDDDDAMDRGFVARMRATVAALLPVAGVDAPLVTGCNRGFFLERKPEGNLIYAVTEKNPIGLGLAMTVPRGSPENIFRRNHRHCSQYYNTFTDVTAPAFLRSVHSDNDSDPHASGKIERCEWADVAAEVEAHFPFTAAQLQAL